MRIDDLLAPENLRRMIERRPAGDVWPYYAGGTESEIEAHIDHAIAALGRLQGICVEKNPDHYGCGYASYADCFAWRSDGHGVRRSETEVEIDGLSLWISRLAPVACLAPSKEWRGERHGGSYVLDPERLDALPDTSWHDHVQSIRTALAGLGYEVLPREVALRPLPFEASIRTNWGGPPYRFFDAVFFWED